jgi:hypothetical protein
MRMPTEDVKKNPGYSIIFVLAFFVLVVLGGVGYVLFGSDLLERSRTGVTSLDTLPQQIAAKEDPIKLRILDAYKEITNGGLTPGNQNFLEALAIFRDIAADESNAPGHRAQALNGINYAYTQSNFSATDLKNVVFSTPPFSQYFEKTKAVAADPLHPESGPDVADVEAALVKLNQLSNSLMPNHYAIGRMEVAEVFAYQRAAAKVVTREQKTKLMRQSAENAKPLVEAFEALEPLNSQNYAMPMRMQIMFAHASTLAFIGYAQNDRTYHDRGEVAFQETIQQDGAYPTTNIDSTAALNQTLLARIFYISYYWKRYKDSDPKRIQDVARPLMDVDRIQKTDFYSEYLPTHKAATVAPFATLREVAKTMPELKTFLQGRGWKF